ncbi:MAG TPA: hypothetical protein VIV11_20245 [Kofleriaceae bacterium]
MPGSRSLADRLYLLRAQADACRSQAIRLNAKLSLLERDRGDVRGMRERLAASSARLDHAVDGLMRSARRG